ncbi:MAG: hypothetical protein KC468_08945 [Myxococcales bacterium]|nr:hypothetical protein [Myxococcales bacterium]
MSSERASASERATTTRLDGSREAGEPVGVGALVVALGLLTLTGPALPIARGWGAPIVVAIVCGALAIVRGRAWTGRRDDPAPDAPWARGMLGALMLLPAVLIGAVAARCAAALLIAFPGTWWALAALLPMGLLLAPRAVRGRGWLRAALVAAAVGVVAIAGTRGAEFETAGADSGGFAHSGPIFGIHPYQTTAIMIDGYGPFDVPINDFVTPDGARGYGPEAYAKILEETLHAIAELHFADGPARARAAFANATVEAVMTPPVRESLDREPAEREHHRVIVRSGSTGQRARVEFRCPGIPPGPRPLEPDGVMEQQCSNKYVTESSAGLGLTGRWSGYFEVRGRERVGLAPMLGWTRSDDTVGRRVVSREQRYNAWNLLALLGVLGLVLLAGGRSQRMLDGITDVSAGIGAVLSVGVLTLIVGLAFTGDGLHPSVPAWSNLGPGGGDGLGDRALVTGWMAALAVVAAPGLSPASRDASARSRMSRWLCGFPALLVVASTFALAGNLSGLSWIRPELWFYRGANAHGVVLDGYELALERFALALGELAHRALNLEISQAETLVATGLLAVLVGLLASMACSVPRWIGQHVAPEGGEATDRVEVISRLVWLAGALALVGSLRTFGGAALLPGALALAALVASVAAPPRRPLVGVLVSLGWAGVLAKSLLEILFTGPSSPFLALMVTLGFAAGLGSLALALRRFVGTRKDRGGER